MSVGVALSPLTCVLAFDGNNRIAVRRRGALLDLPFVGPDLETVERGLKAVFGGYSHPSERFQADLEGRPLRVHFTEVEGSPADPEIEMRSADWLDTERARLAPSLANVLTELDPHLIEVPYLNLGENDYIYKFRPERERNNAIYARDAEAGAIYQSRLCSAIKALARRHERSATNPVTLDFGAVRYLVPSHFGFCLGVKNAIERAYETLIENPGKRVFMLSELIHNPFVNEDLIRRGLRYLQSDKGVPYTDGPGGPQLWDTLSSDDVVIIPAFGATDEDKRRLVRKGIAIRQYDATCMLVEKVWKAARAYGREGYTVIIHGKHEHEETKATFSNTRRYAPAIIVRNMDEARQLGEIILKADARSRTKFASLFDGKLTPGFDFDRDLQRVAVVNQTTLLVNETREIIAHMRRVFAEKYGDEVPGARPRIGGHDRTDTLCYATQVNQDALARALSEPIDAAFVVGGKNSSNTYQLYRLCEQYLGDRAFFIQSEANILSEDEAENYVFPAKGRMGPGGHHERKALWTTPREKEFSAPRRVLITGGASCPDGIIQQVIFRLNSFYPPGSLRDIETVLADLAGG